MSRFEWSVTRVCDGVTWHNMTIIMFLSQSHDNYNICHSNYTSSPPRALFLLHFKSRGQSRGVRMMFISCIVFKYFSGFYVERFSQSPPLFISSMMSRMTNTLNEMWWELSEVSQTSHLSHASEKLSWIVNADLSCCYWFKRTHHHITCKI